MLDLRPSLVKILSPNTDQINGTGFLCHPDGYLITCFHVVRALFESHATEACLIWQDQKVEAALVKEHTYEKHDLAILQMRNKPKTLSYLEVDVHARARSGDLVRSFGYPEGYWEKDGIAINGEIGVSTRIEDTDVVQIVGLDIENVDGGFSGAPVFDCRIAKVVGLVHARYSRNQAFFVSLTAIIEKWSELRNFHDAFKPLRAAVADGSKQYLANNLRGTPFIRRTLEEGVLQDKRPKRRAWVLELSSGTFVQRRGMPLSSQPRQLSSEIADLNRNWNDIEIERLLTLAKPYILMSDVGAGKTVLLQWLVTEIIGKTDKVPFFLECNQLQYGKVTTWDDFRAFLVKWYRDLLRDPDPESLLEAGRQSERLVFLFDGLDQIASGDYALFAKALIKLAGPAIIISSRPSAVRALHHEPRLTFLRPEPFSKKDQTIYFGAEYYAEAVGIGAFAEDFLRIPMLAFMVKTLICSGEAMQINTRAELYSRFIDHILHHHEPNADLFDDNFDLYYDICLAIHSIAWAGLSETEAQIGQISVTLAKTAMGRSGVNLKLEQLPKAGLVNLVIARGDTSQPLISFTHHSFQEFLAAEYLTQRPDLMDRVVHEMWAPKWDQVIRFFAALTDGKIIPKIYPEQRDNIIHSRLFLAAECWAELRRPVNDVPEVIINDLTKLAETPPFSQTCFLGLIRLGAFQRIQETLFKMPEALVDNFSKDFIAIVDQINDEAFLESLVTWLLPLGASCSDAQCTWGGQKPPLWIYMIYEPGPLGSNVIDLLKRVVKRLGLPGLHSLSSRLWDRDRGIRWLATVLLGTIVERFDSVTCQAFASRLSDPDPEVRSLSAKGLATLGLRLEPVYREAIISLLSDKDKMVRAIAAGAMEQVQEKLDEWTQRALNDFLSDEEEDVRRFAADLLARFGDRNDPAAIKTLAANLTHTDVAVREQALKAFTSAAERLNQTALKVLVILVRDPPSLVGVALLIQLFENLDRLELRSLVNFFADMDSKLQTTAATILAVVENPHDPGAFSRLAPILQEDHPANLFAAAALRRIGLSLDTEALTALIALHTYGPPLVRRALFLVMGHAATRFNPLAIRVLATALSENDLYVSQVAAGALLELVMALSGFGGSGATNRERALEALNKFAEEVDPGSLDELPSKLADPSPTTRVAVTAILAAAADRLAPKSLQAVVSCLDSSDLQTRTVATTFLAFPARRSFPPAIEQLTICLKNDESIIRLIAIDALGLLGEDLGSQALEALTRRLEDRNPIIRLVAARKLAPVANRLAPEVLYTIIRLRLHPDTDVQDLPEGFLTIAGLAGGSLSLDESLRRTASEILSNVASGLDPAMIANIVSWLEEDDPDLRLVIVGALKPVIGLLEPAVMQALCARLSDPEPAVRRAVIDALAEAPSRLTPSMWEEIIDLFSDKDAVVRLVTVELLAAAAEDIDDTLIQRLVVSLKDDDPHVRQMVAEGLGRIADRLDKMALRGLAALMLDDYPAVRRAATTALGPVAQSLDQESIEAVAAILSDEDVGKRWNAFDLLRAAYRAGVSLPLS